MSTKYVNIDEQNWYSFVLLFQISLFCFEYNLDIDNHRVDLKCTTTQPCKDAIYKTGNKKWNSLFTQVVNCMWNKNTGCAFQQ